MAVSWGRGPRSGVPPDGDDDLADLFVGFQVPVRLDDLVEREGPGDDRRECTVGQSALDECDSPGESRRIARDLEQRVSAQREAVRQRLEQREGSRLQAEEAVDEDRAALRRRVGKGLDV